LVRVCLGVEKGRAWEKEESGRNRGFCKGRILEGLDKFLKSNQCCYNNLRIENILISRKMICGTKQM